MTGVRNTRIDSSQARVREALAIHRLAEVLKVRLDPRKENCELLEELALVAERYLTDAIIRERL